MGDTDSSNDETWLRRRVSLFLAAMAGAAIPLLAVLALLNGSAGDNEVEVLGEDVAESTTIGTTTSSDPASTGAQITPRGVNEAQHGDAVTSVDWADTTGGTRIASGDRTGVLIIWDPDVGPVHRLETNTGKLEDLAWSPNGQLLAVAAGDSIEVWDAADFDIAPRVLVGPARRVRWKSTSSELVAVAWQEVFVVDVESMQRLASTYIPTNERPEIWSLAVSPDDRYIAAGDDDGTISVWPIGSAEPPQMLSSSRDRIRHLAWSPDGALVSGGNDSTLRFWDLELGENDRTWEDAASTSDFGWSPTGGQLASAGGSKSIRIWDLGRGEVSQRLQGHVDLTLTLDWGPDGRLATGGTDGVVLLWSFEEGVEPAAVTLGE